LQRSWENFVANDTSTNPLPNREAEALARGEKIIERLRRGDLPQMVDWFDPGLLAKVGVRTVISSTLGSYTDQRLMQAATDNVATEAELANRYNYTGESIKVDGAVLSTERLPAEPDGAVWIDYIADLGDGFEATYAMAYLLAADELKVAGESAPLPAGRLLIMGGDQVYPDATKQEYSIRLRDPYDWAFSTAEPKRKLFAIPGNHDWYDGLSAFSALFCSARDRISKGLGTQIGGWRCQQHRSYFAIKLPHNWWIWGPDIQLADNLDDSQRDYFDLMAEQTKPGDTIILCIAEPSWLHQNYDNLHEISMLARKHGAKICAVVAGDWHHYSRYTTDKLGIQFITAGGGGAFAHATHGLKQRVALRWPTRTDANSAVSSKTDTEAFNRIENEVIGTSGSDFTMAVPDVLAAKAKAVAHEPKPLTDIDAGPGGIGRRAKPVRKEDIKSSAYNCQAMSIYPPKSTSRLLCLKNLALPFRNRPFTYLVGMIYFIFAWAFVAADPQQSPITRNVVQSIDLEASRKQSELTASKTASLQKPADPATTALELRLEAEIALLAEQRKAVEGASVTKLSEKIQTGIAARLNDLSDGKISFGAAVTGMVGEVLKGSLASMFDPKPIIDAAELSPMFAFMLIGLWAGLVSYVESESRLVRILIGTLHAAAHIAALLFVSWLASATGFVPWLIGKIPWVSSDIARILWNVLVALFAGGLLGGFVMGLYWTLTSTLFNMHTGDAFGALGIKDYKNFLRIKLEPGRATIYPIALDRVPGRKGWRWQLGKGEQRPAHNPQIMPVNPLKPRMIEKTPIVIEADKVLA
jgi:hypothetical protein